MSAIIDFFEGIFEVVSSIVDFIVSFFEDIIFIVKTLGEFIVKVPSMLGFLPTAVVSILLVGVSVVIIYKVVGRD